MARSLMGAGVADFVYGVFEIAGRQLVDLEPATLTLWSAKVGGTQYTDLLLDGVAVTSIPVGEDGQVPQFQGPDGITSVWADAGGPRVLMTNMEGLAAQAVAAAASVNREAANGVAGLDASGKLYETRIPTRLGDTALETKYARTANRPINLREAAPTIDWTGATDSRAALQAALTAAGPRRVEWGREGVIRCHTGITLPLFQTLAGNAQYLGAGGTVTSEIVFPTLTGSQVGITGGGANVVEDLLIRGPMTGVAGPVGFDSPSGSPRFYRVAFHGWGTGARLAGAYYTLFDGCEWIRNQYALVNTDCYNLHLRTPMMYCRYGPSDVSFGRGINGTARGMTITGGSIEGYGPGGAITMASAQVLDMTGVYFESTEVGADPFGINAVGLTQIAINMHGCTIYLNEHSRFVFLSTSTSVTIESSGNKFVCPTSSVVTPTAYYFTASDVANIKGRIGDDDWSEMAEGAYVTPGVFNLGQIPNLDIRHPTLKYLGGDVCGTGSPEGVVAGRIGAIYRRLDGGAATSIYVKQSGTDTVNGWIGK